MLIQMFTIENSKLTRRTMFWVEMAALVLTVLGMMALMAFIRQTLLSGAPADSSLTVDGINLAQTESFLTWPQSFSFVMGVIYTVGTLLTLVLAGAVTAQEYTWRSYQLWLSRGVPRWQVVLAKFMAVTLATFLFITVATLVLTVVSGIASQLILGSLPFAAVSWPNLLLTILTVTLSLLPYAALGLLLAISARSTVVAIGGGLAFTLLAEPVVQQLMPLLGERWAQASLYLPTSLGQLLNRYATNMIVVNGDALPTLGVTPTIAAFMLGVYTLVLLVTAVILFQRQDLGG
ncbi:MAG TPA: ABC transporter permease subunit [Anaerolineae bacterium]|nr:ABC transporter permease subunit [Anaerolineae bacterium]